MRFFQFPKWFRTLYPGAIWDFFLKKDNAIYITFDDGPNPTTTPQILEILDRFNAKATFFCLGKNVKENPALLSLIQSKGHAIGNHGMQHLDGYLTANDLYLQDAKEAKEIIGSNLFRPAYGRVKRSQFKLLKKEGYQIIFWSIISYDFDNTFPPEKIISLLEKKVKPGSIVVFHDSEKAWPNLKVVLPVIVESWTRQGYTLKAIEL